MKTAVKKLFGGKRKKSFKKCKVQESCDDSEGDTELETDKFD
jgi:hypothetical protein